jgi:hypothetical protein
MMIPKSKRPVTVEDLMQLKRAERPASEFWAEFDRELRAKQLAALVEKRPWWHAVPRAFSGFARYRLPLGATAILAVTFLSLRDYRDGSSTDSHLATLDPASRATATAAPVARMAAPTEAIAQTNDVSATAEPTIVARQRGETGTHDFVLRSSPAAEQFSRTVPLFSGKLPSGEVQRPSERLIAENLANARAVLGAPTNFEARALPARPAATEPLAQMTPPAEARRSRFTTAFVSASADVPAADAERFARRLSDERLYDTIRRFGAKGNSLSVRF